MKRFCLILAAWLAALAIPAIARAGLVALRVQTIAHGARTLQGATAHFNMLGFKGRGTIRFRAHRIGGGWSGWQIADDDPAWTGASDAFQVRSAGPVRAYELWSRVTTAPVRHLAEAGTPAIVTRAQWKADEEIVRAKPTFSPEIKLAVVHHTVNSNTYTPAEAAAIVRGIETYHVKANGWNDIGYNFLVDRFGNVYEGRAGGIDKNVVGAHAEGFNRDTVGVSLIGNFQTAKPTKQMQDALVQMLAWRLDVAHVDPLSTVVYTSGGNAKFAAGKLVTLRAISGHRDTGPTECPGTAAYAQLPAITKRVAATGLPKLYSPVVVGVLGGPIRFQARLSSPLAWTVTVAQAGKTIATGTGHGATVDWTWGSPVSKNGYTWTISAPGIRIATGAIGKPVAPPPPPVALALTKVSATPTTFVPDASGNFGAATVAYTLSAPATVIVSVTDASGALVLALFDGGRPAGSQTVSWTPADLPRDGRYRIMVTATAGAKSVTKWVDVVRDATLAGLTASEGTYGVTFSFTLAAQANVRLDVVDATGAVVATPFAGLLQAGPASIAWDETASGARVPAGSYRVVATVTDALGQVTVSVPLSLSG